jgi:histone deacetylase complex subunit SAP18
MIIAESEQIIDRPSTTPVFLRCFWKLQRHHHIAEYRNVSKDVFPSREVQVYTWPDATLREITELLKEAIQEIREPMVLLHYNLVCVDRIGQWIMKPVSNCFVALLRFN